MFAIFFVLFLQKIDLFNYFNVSICVPFLPLARRKGKINLWFTK